VLRIQPPAVFCIDLLTRPLLARPERNIVPANEAFVKLVGQSRMNSHAHHVHHIECHRRAVSKQRCREFRTWSFSGSALALAKMAIERLLSVNCSSVRPWRPGGVPTSLKTSRGANQQWRDSRSRQSRQKEFRHYIANRNAECHGLES
jgi:hypothetical protein